MSDAVLTVLKFCLLALVYLFLFRVVLLVARELRGTPAPSAVPPTPAPSPAAPRKTERAKRGRRSTWRLVVTEPPDGKGQILAVDGDATVGRGGGCTFPITFDTFVSQVHARAFVTDGALWVEDLGSTNGTFVNGKRIEHPVKLRKGDDVQVGETHFRVER